MEGFGEGEALAASKRAFIQAASWSYSGIITRALLDESSFRCGRVYERKEDTSDNQPSYTIEVNYAGSADWWVCVLLDNASISRSFVESITLRHGKVSGLHSSPLILSGGYSPCLNVYICSLYPLDISERFLPCGSRSVPLLGLLDARCRCLWGC
jgi:hypothetical protein